MNHLHTEMVTDQFDADLSELQRVVRVQRVLADPASFYEDIMGDCKGDCVAPRVLIEHGGRRITCCAFKITYDLVRDAKRLERHVRQRIARSGEVANASTLADTQRRRRIDGLALKRALPRDFTGTFAGRRAALFEENGEVEDPVPRHAVPKRHQKRA